MDVREKTASEKRLIDANALQRVLLPITSALEHEYGSLGGAVSGVMKHIDSAPAVDAVIPVRCAQCKHFKRNLENDTYCSSINGLTDPQEDDFCSYGERKEGAD